MTDAALFALGWCCGWLLLCRPRRLPSAAPPRAAVAVVIPARDEASSIGPLVEAIVAQLREGDELVVVDDGSSDATAQIAAAAGATVIAAGELPAGWAGKPHACAVGAAATTAARLVFLDADVHPQPDLLDALAAPSEPLVSVQPWHAPRGIIEQLSMMFNITALMGSAAFTVFGRTVRTRVAFGAVMSLPREVYESVGGHASPAVRGAILEDIALARAVGRAHLFVGETSFRMYPNGLRAMVDGWTKGMGIGASATPWWALLATAAWVASVAGGLFVSPWFAIPTIVQLAVLARIAGRFHPLTILLYPIATAFFVVVFVRSVVLRLFRLPVSWRGRTLRPDQETC